MRRILTIGAIGLAATMAMAQPQRGKKPPRSQGHGQGQGLCRNAPGLAALPPEDARNQQRGRGDPVPMPLAIPAPPPEADSKSSRDIVVTGSARRSDDVAAPVTVAPPADGAPPPVAPPPPPPPAPMEPPPPTSMSVPPPPSSDGIVAGRGYAPRSGILTAGEHDDLLNPELYSNYVRRSDLGQRWPVLPLVDTGRALTVAVTDSAGQPLPLADVTLTCADGNSLTFKTLADGTAIFFPALDRLGSSVRLSVTSRGRPIAGTRTVLIPSQPGPQRVSVTAAAQAAQTTKFDLMLVLDTTGSMGDEISYLKSELRAILSSIKQAHPQLDMRIGLVFYRDTTDDYVTLSIPFTGDVNAAQRELQRQFASGGGDYPEAVDAAMNRAVNDFAWRPDAVKSMLWVADAPPHDDLVGKAWAAAEVARAKRIQIVPVAASGVAKEAEFMMRAMAAATQSRYLFLTDDSGVGMPHSKPAIDCYLVTKLDALVRRVLDSQISGRRIEPNAGEVIRAVGKYDAGKCVLPASNWQGED